MDGDDKDAHVRELKATLASIDSIDVLKEAQEMSLTHDRQVYDLSIHVQHSFEEFSDCMPGMVNRSMASFGSNMTLPLNMKKINLAGLLGLYKLSLLGQALSVWSVWC